MIWFTADQHFGHENVIKYCQRPFRNSNHMTEVLQGKYNARVTPEDTVFFLGDLTLSNSPFIIEGILKRLQGTKVLILGNHDKLDALRYVDVGFQSVHTSLVVEEFTLVHDPALSAVDRNRQFLCGHVHELFKRQRNCLNVGVDVWDFFPASIGDVRNELAEV